MDRRKPDMDKEIARKFAKLIIKVSQEVSGDKAKNNNGLTFRDHYRRQK